MSDFVVKDSGEREAFSTGAVRDTADDKPRIDLISPFFLKRLGNHLRRGAKKYSEWNWAKGIPNSRCYASAMRHLIAYASGECADNYKECEDHLAAAAFNIMAMIHNEEVLNENLQLDLNAKSELVDLPVFKPGKIKE